MREVFFAGSLPRTDHEADSCEDRHAVRRTPSGLLRAAIADGASSTLFSGLWAELLTATFIEDEASEPTLPDLTGIRRTWYDTVTRQPLPWHLQAKLGQGAAAAFLGLTVTDRGRWSALSVGDCGLFHLREDRCITAFPEEDPDNMPALPSLLRTHAGESDYLHTIARTQTGDVIAGDRFLLMTDALAAWFLREWRREHAPWKWLEDIRHPSVFRHRITQLRRMGRLVEDDITLIHLRIPPTPTEAAP
ncbi:MAG: protein phosphatase 2C domain-containing protein [Capsulimonadales bacterium]|nr:protein phosphatase 2C domain-containing protein [Capsulimonadales bacterium]